MANDVLMAPGAFDADAEQIRRRMAYAQMLQQQSQQTPQGQMVSGHYVAPSWTQHAANLLRAYAGRKGEDQALSDYRGLADQRRTEGAADVSKMAALLRGSPENTPGDGMGPTMPATGPDLAGALSMAAQSRNPALQGMAPALLSSMTPKAAEWIRVEQFNNATGRKEVVMVNKNNPGQVMPMGGQEAVRGVVVNGTIADPSVIGTNVPKQPDAPNPGRDLVLPDADGNLVPNKPVIDARRNVAAPQVDLAKDLIIPDGNGGFKLNEQLFNAQVALRKAGRPSTTVNVDTANKPLLTELGKGIGEQLVGDFNGAKAASQTLNNVQQIRSGLANVMAGPTANARIKLAQIGEVLGINGKDTTEKLTNTRAAIQGLARQELAAAGSMKGQGQITEAERGILRRAESGDISELTVPEINTLLSALEKTAKYRIDQHSRNVDKLKRDPNAAGVVPYMDVPTPKGGGWSIEPAN